MWQGIKNIYHLGIAILANMFYGFPSGKLRVIGVTGTDGKTTTTSLIYHILNKAGLNASMVTSIGAVINGKNYDVGFHVTTPSSFEIQRFLKKATSAEVAYENFLARSSQMNILKEFKMRAGENFISSPRRYKSFLVLEVTSHALDQYRVFGINFEVGVLTNVTHEHLDYHKTYESYVKTKAKLLKMSKIAVLNKDDNSYGVISNFLASRRSGQFPISNKIITYGLKGNADVNPKNFPFKTNLIGEFNKYNILAAISACKEIGISTDAIRKGIESFFPPLGREDIVYKKDFTVMIDFAHTPNAFDQILKSIRQKVNGRIIHVFSSAGLRDISKRPLMGKNSSQYADIIILTSEDPRSEPIGKINAGIKSGIPHLVPSASLRASRGKQNSVQLVEIPDRREAVEAAIKMAKKGDFVLITGKSHEKSMNYGHEETPWDEYKVVNDALKTI